MMKLKEVKKRPRAIHKKIAENEPTPIKQEESNRNITFGSYSNNLF